jgi:hypothetical protein
MKDGLVPGIYRWIAHQSSKPDLLSALHIGRNCQATDPRDKVFALLGLLDGRLDAAVKADYGLTVAEVFTQIAAYLIQSRNDLAVLSYVSKDSGPGYTSVELQSEWEQWRRALGMGRYHKPLNIPSWVPDWSASSYSEPLKPYYSDKHSMELVGQWHCNAPVMYFAAGKSFQKAETVLTTLSSLSVLSMFAIRLDTVEDHMSPMNAERVVEESPVRTLSRDGWQSLYMGDRQSWNSYDQYDYQPPRHHQSSCDRTNHFWTRTTGSSNLHGAHTTYPSVFRANTACHCTSTQHEDFDEIELEAFESKIPSQAAGRENFRTKHTLGFGPRSTQHGDTIWRLQGAAVPIILRLITENQYIVIGECYLHGADRLEGCWSSELEPHGRCYVHSTHREADCGIPQIIKLQ